MQGQGAKKAEAETTAEGTEAESEEMKCEDCDGEGCCDEECYDEGDEGALECTNGFDGHVADCQLLDSELERVHKKVDDYDGDSPMFKTQTAMLKKLQDRLLELTAPE